jgi:hypothetical protein
LQTVVARSGFSLGLVGILLGLSACGSSSSRPTVHTITAVKTVTANTAAVSTTRANAVPITMPCVDETTHRIDFVSGPVNCHIETAPGGLATTTLLKSLTWQQWGQPSATATGLRDCVQHCNENPPSVSVTVTVYRIIDHRYTRMTVMGPGLIPVVTHLDELPPEPPATTTSAPPPEQTSPAPTTQQTECATLEAVWKLKGEEKGRQAVSEAAEAEERGSPCNLRGAAAQGSVKAQKEAEPGGP